MVVLVFVLTFVFEITAHVAKGIFFLWLALSLTDLILLFRTRIGIRGTRKAPEKLSNGDENEIKILLENLYPFVVSLNIVDEIPHQFQRRDLNFQATMRPGTSQTIQYFLRPLKRGVYSFGATNVLVLSPLGLLARRFKFSGNAEVPVYPPYMQMRKFELLAISNRLTDAGIKRIRRIGQNTEFELIKEYVSGDDVRTINWKATARKNSLMVNHYQDERSQQVYSLIDKGRVMEMPFNGLSLLDYAINAVVLVSNIL